MTEAVAFLYVLRAYYVLFTTLLSAVCRKRCQLSSRARPFIRAHDLQALHTHIFTLAVHRAWGIFFVVVYGTKSELQIIGTGCAPAVLGVTFMLITVRVGLGWAQEFKHSPTEDAGGTIQWAVPPLSQSAMSNHRDDAGSPAPVPLVNFSLAGATRTGTIKDDDGERSNTATEMEKKKQGFVLGIV